MNTKQQALPAPPGLIAALTSGFDLVANHTALILFPILLDLLLWWGPRIRLSRLMDELWEQIQLLAAANVNETGQMLQMSREFWTAAFERINVLSALRGIPVGIPSLMTGRMPLETPWGSPLFIELPSPLQAIILWIVFAFLGLWLGAFYFGLVAQISANHRVLWGQLFNSWRHWGWQAVFLTVFWLLLLLAVSIPATIIVAIVGLFSFGLSQLLLLLFSGMIVWIYFPLLFSPHGIFIKGQNALLAMRDSVRLTRYLLGRTVGFIFIALLMYQGLNRLWSVPDEGSFFSLIGVAGHAFVATGLLAASFVYYKNAYDWMQNVIAQLSAGRSSITREK
jgi:hypothetical protein